MKDSRLSVDATKGRGNHSRRTPPSGCLSMKRLFAFLPFVVFAAACNDAQITQPDPLDSSQIGASAGGGPTESQRLRGLGGRVFAVSVEEVSPPGPGFDNCYTFLANGTFVDPLFPAPPGVPGTWTQHSVGAATTYTATAEFQIPGGGPLVTLVQEGTVTPAPGRGILQLEANTTVFVGEAPTFVFFSRGQEVDVCP